MAEVKGGLVCEQWLLLGWPWSNWKVDKEEEWQGIHFLFCNVRTGLVKQGFCTSVRQRVRETLTNSWSWESSDCKQTAPESQTARLLSSVCVCVHLWVTVPFRIFLHFDWTKLCPHSVCAPDPIFCCSRLYITLTHCCHTPCRIDSQSSLDCLLIHCQGMLKVAVHVWSSISIHQSTKLMEQNYSRHKKCWTILRKPLQQNVKCLTLKSRPVSWSQRRIHILYVFGCFAIEKEFFNIVILILFITLLFYYFSSLLWVSVYVHLCRLCDFVLGFFWGGVVCALDGLGLSWE